MKQKQRAVMAYPLPGLAIPNRSGQDGSFNKFKYLLLARLYAFCCLYRGHLLNQSPHLFVSERLEGTGAERGSMSWQFCLLNPLLVANYLFQVYAIPAGFVIVSKGNPAPH